MTTYFVDASYAGPDASDGSEDHPYTTIQAALNAAPAGSTVSVAAGTYTGNIVISKAVILEGAGAGSTTINGVAGGALGAIVVSPGVNGVTIDGFKVVGFDGAPGIETAAIYLQGAHNGITITNNNVVANGDAGLMCESGPVVTNVLVDGNEFSGKTFVGAAPAGNGFGAQFALVDVPRQLVVLSHNTGAGVPSNVSNVTFTNNLITGTAGGTSVTDNSGNPAAPHAQGNTLVTIDAQNSTIADNEFTGYTTGGGVQLRVREENTSIIDNEFSNNSGGNVGTFVDADGAPGTVSGNSIEYGSGDDVIFAVPGNDTIDGGGGSDTIDMTAAGSAGGIVVLEAGIAFSTATGFDTLVNVENAKGSAGNDGLYGTDGDNIFIATAGNDIIDGNGNGADSDTFDASAATGNMQVDLAGGAVTGAFTATLTDIENVKTGSGTDTITLSDAANIVDAGAGTDTAVTSANYAGTAISWNQAAGAFQVGSDTLKNVEKVVFQNSTAGVGGTDAADTGVWLVHNAAELTAALAGATDGDVIKLADGTYTGAFTVVHGVTIEAANGVTANVVIQSATAGVGNGFAIQANDVTIRNVDIVNFYAGVEMSHNSGLTLNNVDLIDNTLGVRKGTAAAVTDFTFSGGSISGASQGIVIYANASGAGAFDGVVIENITVSDVEFKGFYFEQLNNADISGITMNNVGQLGSVAGQHGAGIDLNLKFEAYQNIAIHDFEFTDVGSSFGGDTTADPTGGAIMIKARDDGSYASPAATLDNVHIYDGSIDGTSTGIRVGEPGISTAGPTGVVIEGVAITDAVYGSYDNRTTTPLHVTLTDGDDVANVTSASTGPFIFEGGEGDDAITGGAGVDTAVFNAAYDADAVSGTGTTFTVDGGDDGTDTLVGIEKAVFNNGTVADTGDDTTVWLVDDAADLTYALAHAADGDVIQLSSGDFTGDFTVSSSVTILGANHGVGTDGTRGAESRIIGHLIVESGTALNPETIVIDGVEMFVNTTTGFSSHGNAAMQVHGAGNTTIANSLFYSDVVGGAVEVTGIQLNTTATGHVTIDNNVFDGSKHSGFGGASWQRGIWSDGATTSLEISNNEFQWVRSGVNLDGYDDAKVDVHHNTFVGTGSVGTAFSIGIPAPGTTYENIHHNVLDGAGSDFNFKNLTTGITFDFGATGNTSTTPVEILGTQGSDSIDGGDGNDVIAGDGTLPAESNMPSFGNDTLNGHDGDDVLFGGRGNDVLDGGAGNDTVLGGDGDDVIIASADDDVVDGGVGTDTLSVSGTAALEVQGGAWVATTAGGTATLSNVEIVDDSAAGRTLLVGAGGFATIQAAINAAQDGDTILIADGTYNENVVVDKAVTILGANHGLDGDDPARGDESAIDGGFYIHAANVTIDGVKVFGGGTHGGNPAGLYVDKNGFTFENSVLEGDGSHAIGLSTPYGGNVTGLVISGNLITGWDNSAYINPTTQVTVTGNHFDDTGSLNIDGLATGSFVDLNEFTNIGGAPIAYSVVDANEDVGQFIGTGNTFDNGPTRDVSIYVYGATDGSDVSTTVTGTSLNDRFVTDYMYNANSNDTFYGAGGDDLLAGGGGNDSLDGGTGNDTLLGGTGNDTITGGDGADSIDAGDGVDTVVFEHDINEYVIQWNAGTSTYDISRNGTHDTVKGAEFLKFGTLTVDVQGDEDAVINQFAPVFSSGSTGTVAEGAPISTVVYDAAATDVDSAAVFGNIVYSLSGTDAAAFNIDSATGEVRLNASADYETKASYSFNVVATQGITSASKAVTVGVTDVNDNNPVFSSASTATVAEGTAASAVVYDANATDADAGFGAIVYSLDGADQNDFTINASTGEVKLKAVSNFEAKASYSFSVVATQGSTSESHAVTLNVTDVNDNNPVFSSGSTGTVLEGAALSTVIYDANATDADSSATFGDIEYSLSGTDAGALNIDSDTGEVTLKAVADREAKASYTFNVVATQGTTSASKAVTVNVTDVNDNNPVFSSGTTATVAEGTPATTVVYDANATDADTGFGAIVYSLDGADKNAFTIDASTGQVRLKVASDFETKSSYAFSVVATQGITSSSRAVTLNVTNVNEPIGGLGTKTVQVEAGSEKAALGTLASTAGLTFDVVALNKGGGHVYSGNTELAVGQTGLTLAQINELTFSSKNDGSIQFLAHDGSDTATLQVNLDVTAGVSKTYAGTNNADRLDGADGNDTVLGKKGDDVLLGGAGKDTMDGGRGHDTIYGGAGKDSIKGYHGDDVIYGGAGKDTLEGGAGKDTFVFDTRPHEGNVDTIKDFVHGTDKIALDADIFAAIGTSLGAGEFRKNDTGHAQDSSDKIIYETDTGKLYYDADGDGAGARVIVARFDPNTTTLTYHDFEIV